MRKRWRIHEISETGDLSKRLENMFFFLENDRKIKSKWWFISIQFLNKRKSNSLNYSLKTYIKRILLFCLYRNAKNFSLAFNILFCEKRQINDIFTGIFMYHERINLLNFLYSLSLLEKRVKGIFHPPDSRTFCKIPKSPLWSQSELISHFENREYFEKRFFITFRMSVSCIVEREEIGTLVFVFMTFFHSNLWW